MPIPLKIFGSDASIFLGTNKGVSRITATWPNWFDAITRSFDLDPRLLGTDPLRELVVAYTTTNGTQAAYNLATGCNTTTPSCDNLTADLNPECRAYAVAVASFCAPGGIQNYDTASCVDTLKQAPVDSVTGAVSATTARAFYTACFDCYYLFTANGFALDGKTDTLTSREYLVTGNAKLAQTGGYRIVWLGAGKHPNKG